jgi:hypothetical protein
MGLCRASVTGAGSQEESNSRKARLTMPNLEKLLRFFIHSDFSDLGMMK